MIKKLKGNNVDDVDEVQKVLEGIGDNKEEKIIIIDKAIEAEKNAVVENYAKDTKNLTQQLTNVPEKLDSSQIRKLVELKVGIQTDMNKEDNLKLIMKEMEVITASINKQIKEKKM